jgi:16S rRNA (cytidine1402-2'-O)-methyltransferase
MPVGDLCYNKHMGTLYALGINMYDTKDISQSVIDALKNSDTIFVEHLHADGDLLKKLGIENKTLIEIDKVADEHVDMLNLEDKNAAIITGDGFPSVTDPGATLISRAISTGHNVLVLPQVSALVSATILSGYQITSFFYGGMLDYIDAKTIQTISMNNSPMSIFLYQGTEEAIGLFDILYESDREVKILADMGRDSQKIVTSTVKDIRKDIPEVYRFVTFVIAPKK